MDFLAAVLASPERDYEEILPIKRRRPPPIIFGDRNLSDITLIVEEQDFIVHRMTLASRSDVFRKMLFADYRLENRLELQNVGATEFRRLLELLYQGEISDPDTLLSHDSQHQNKTFVLKNPHIKPNQMNFVKFSQKSLTSVEEWQRLAEHFCLGYMVDDYLEVATARQVCSASRCSECHFALQYAYELECELNPEQKKVSNDLTIDLQHLFSNNFYCLIGWWPQPSPPKCPEALSSRLYFGQKELSDVVLVVGRHGFHVHRMALASRSTVFKEMLYSSTGRPTFEIIQIDSEHVPDSDLPLVFKRLMEIMYEGRVSDPEIYFDYKACKNDPAFKLHNPKLRGNEKNYIKFTNRHSTATGQLNVLAGEFGVKELVQNYHETNAAYVVCRATNCAHCQEAIKFARKEGMEIDSKNIKIKTKKTYIRPSMKEIEDRLYSASHYSAAESAKNSCECNYCDLLS